MATRIETSRSNKRYMGVAAVDVASQTIVWEKGKKPRLDFRGFPNHAGLDITTTKETVITEAGDQTFTIFGVFVAPFADLTALAADNDFGDGEFEGDPFEPGQFVTLEDESIAFWDGVEWAVGSAPYPDPNDITQAIFGAAVAPFADLEELGLDEEFGDGIWDGIAFTEGQYVILGDDSIAFWDGEAWDAGAAPEPEPEEPEE